MEWTPIIDCAYDAKFTIGDEDGSYHRLVTIQLKDFEGKNLNVKNSIHVYFTTDSGGNTLETLDDAIVAVSYGIAHEIVTKSCVLLITEDDGKVAFTVDAESGTTCHVNVILPNGKVVTSVALTYTG